jgi:transposase InsO family protein
MKEYPNLIRGFDFYRPNQLWVSDITYVSLKDGFAYLSLITDAYSHKIAGYKLNQTLESDGNISALRVAIENTPEDRRGGLIHHSDRGVQYCCREYIKILESNNIRISMTENGDPYENVLAEQVNGILKAEWLDHEQFMDFQQANDRVCQVINTYNTIHPHMSAIY